MKTLGQRTPARSDADSYRGHIWQARDGWLLQPAASTDRRGRSRLGARLTAAEGANLTAVDEKEQCQHTKTNTKQEEKTRVAIPNSPTEIEICMKSHVYLKL